MNSVLQTLYGEKILISPLHNIYFISKNKSFKKLQVL